MMAHPESLGDSRGTGRGTGKVQPVGLVVVGGFLERTLPERKVGVSTAEMIPYWGDMKD